MFEVGRDREEPLDFLAAQDLRQSLRRFGTRETKLGLTLPKRDAIEEPQEAVFVRDGSGRRPSA
jgi:hypothetical protein